MVKRTQSPLHKPSKHETWPDKAPLICMKQIKMLNKWKYSLLSRGWPRSVTSTGLCISRLPAINDLIFFLMICREKMENSLSGLVLVGLSPVSVCSWVLFIRFVAVHREYDIELTCFTVRVTLGKVQKV